MFLGTDPGTGDQVAVKVLDRPGEEWRRDLMRSEVAAMLRVDSPHCVRVRDFIDEPGRAAIVTDYVEGASLKAVLENHGRLDGPQALGVLTGALAGISAVHAVGLVHADVKPDNIVVDTQGRSRLIDFGLSGPPRSLGTDGQWTGTPAYISPEQVKGHHVDARSDLYSLGVVLFELLCGRKPFQAGNPVLTASLHVNAPVPDPRAFAPEVSDILAALCMQSLDKDPAVRMQSADAFAAALQHAALGAYGADWLAMSGLSAVVGGVLGSVPVGAALLGAPVAVGGFVAGGAAASAGVAAGAGAGAAAGGASAAGGGAATAASGAVATGLGAKGVVAAAVAVVGVAAGGGVAVVATQGGDEEPRGRQLSAQALSFDHGLSVLDEPRDEWTFLADDYLPGSHVSVMDTNPIYGGETPQVYGFSDTFVVHLTTSWGDRRPDSNALVGIDAETGEVRWELDRSLKVGDTCRPVLEDSMLVCLSPGRDGETLLIDPVDGSIDGHQPLGRNESWDQIYSDETTVYLVGFAALRAFGGKDLTPLWELKLDTRGAAAGEDIPSMMVGRDTLLVSYGYLNWRVEKASGGLIERVREKRRWITTDGLRLDVVYDPEVTSVTAADGSHLMTAPGGWWGGYGGDPVVNGRLGVGDALYDLARGAEVWSRPDLATIDPMWIADGRYLAWNESGDDWGASYEDDGRSTIVDASSGDTVAELDGEVRASSLLATQDGLVIAKTPIYYSSDEVPPPIAVEVVSLLDGHVAWSRDVGDLAGEETSPDGFLTVALSDQTVALVEERGLRGYTDFPSHRSGDGGDDGDRGTTYLTDCGTPPEFVPVEVVAESGGVQIEYDVRATCPGGQWLNDTQLRVPLSVGGEIWADGYYDFGDDPIWVPDSGTTIPLVYPFEHTSAPLSDIAGAVDRRASGESGEEGDEDFVYVPCEPGPDNGDAPVPASPEDGGSTATPRQSEGAPDQSIDERDETALEALQRIAAEDEAAVEALDWTAQLSSKRPGIRDDGIVYDSYDDILALHLRLRALYPESLLVWSGDWPGSYGPTSRDFWVTLSGASESTTAPILRWCSAEGWSRGDCWAKRLLRTGRKPELTIDMAPPDARNNR